MQVQGRQTYHQDFLNSPGLQKGLLGMKEGEIRTLIVEPEQGYKNTVWAIPNEEYRNSTLVYDIHILQIEPSLHSLLAPTAHPGLLFTDTCFRCTPSPPCFSGWT